MHTMHPPNTNLTEENIIFASTLSVCLFILNLFLSFFLLFLPFFYLFPSLHPSLTRVSINKEEFPLSIQVQKVFPLFLSCLMFNRQFLLQTLHTGSQRHLRSVASSLLQLAIVDSMIGWVN